MIIQFIKQIIESVFSIKNFYEGTNKYKVFKLLSIRYMRKVKYRKNLRNFIKNSKIEPLNYPLTKPRKKVYLSIVAIFKDEPDIIEWIKYHHYIGVERFYLYDNNSTINYEKILMPYISSGLVVYQKIDGNCMQKPVYRDAVYRYSNETFWLAIIDLDEYIVPVVESNLKTFLKEYEEYPAVVANWVMFDSNNLEKRPRDKTVIESYTRTYKDIQTDINRTVKSIVKPSEVRYLPSVHICLYKGNKLAVDENKIPFKGETFFKTEKVSINKIRINHYHCKSKEDYLNKINKGFADSKNIRKFDNRRLNFKNTKKDTIILKYLPALK